MVWTKKNSPSRLRFRPSLPGTFGLPPCGFRLLPSGATSTYSRSVLGARANLEGGHGARKGVENVVPAICGDFSLSMAELALLVTCSKGKKIHRAGCAFVHLSRELSAFRLAASAYCPQERLRPTRAPCSVQGETYAAGRGRARGERRRKVRSLRVLPGEILWISHELGVEAGKHGGRVGERTGPVQRRGRSRGFPRARTRLSTRRARSLRRRSGRVREEGRSSPATPAGPPDVSTPAFHNIDYRAAGGGKPNRVVWVFRRAAR